MSLDYFKLNLEPAIIPIALEAAFVPAPSRVLRDSFIKCQCFLNHYQFNIFINCCTLKIHYAFGYFIIVGLNYIVNAEEYFRSKCSVEGNFIDYLLVSFAVI